jgi:hypothetical protein
LEDIARDDPIADWFSDLTGPVLRMEDLSAGAWRHRLPPGAWPPVAASREKRKYLLITGERTFLARFAGLGDIGAAKFRRARMLASESYVPEPLALRRGFLLEPWVAGEPLGPEVAHHPKFLSHLGAYLGFRARRLPAAGEAGAALDALREMAIWNAAELCGEECADAVRRRLVGLPRIAGRLRPVHVDARLQLWEWLRRPDGTFCKTDALDHAESHDLVGPQDIAWDVAGAAIEFGLSAAQTRDLADAVADASGNPADPEALAGFSLCYAALQAGAWAMAEAGAEARERRRIVARREMYAAHLRSPA